MKTLVAAVAAVSLVAISAGAVNAEGYSKPHKLHAHAKRYIRHAAPRRGYEPRYPDESGWYPHDSSQLVVGTTAWWDQMMREGRLGGGGRK
jgi:hypothetical protein